MTPRKRTQITIETERVVTIRRRRSMRAFCPECGCEVDMVTPEELGVLMGTTGLALSDGVEAHGWHVSEGPNGTALICLESLRKSK